MSGISYSGWSPHSWKIHHCANHFLFNLNEPTAVNGLFQLECHHSQAHGMISLLGNPGRFQSILPEKQQTTPRVPTLQWNIKLFRYMPWKCWGGGGFVSTRCRKNLKLHKYKTIRLKSFWVIKEFLVSRTGCNYKSKQRKRLITMNAMDRTFNNLWYV